MDDLRHRVRDHFSTVYITIASVLLGLSLADIVSLLRGLDEHTLFVWLQAFSVIHLIFNAWYAYSIYATVIYAIPTVWDSLSVFLLSAAHFAMAAFIGMSPAYFCFAISVYAGVAIGSIYYAARRSATMTDLGMGVKDLAPTMIINSIASPLFAIVGVLFYRGVLGGAAEIVLGVVTIGYATAWLMLYSRIVSKQVLSRLA